VLASSNSGSLVNFGAGSKDVFVTQPAERALYVASAGTGLESKVTAFTNGGIVYASSTSALATGSALVFDGTTFTSTANTALAKNSGAGWVSIGDNSSGNGSLRLFGGSTQKGWQIGSNITVANALEFSLATAGGGTTFTDQKMILTSTGLGIGTSTPALPLHVYNASAALAYFESTSASGPYVIWRSSGTSIGDIGSSLGISGLGAATDFMIASRSSPLLFGVGSAEKMRLDTSGNLGLGVTPSAWKSTWKAFQLGNRSLAQSVAGAGDLTMVFNGYFDTTDSRWEFQNAGDYSARYSITGAGIHSWHISTGAGANANDPITFIQAMTLDASGNLGIGLTAPTSRLHVSDPSASTNAIAQFTNGTTGTGAGNGLYVGVDTSNEATIFNFYNSAIKFGTNGTERARFNTTGAFVLAGGTTTANGIGITFPATQSASTDANTLDDYEEGTWVPVDNSGASLSFTSVFASYTKIGRAVTINLELTFPITANTSAVAISLVFPSSSSTRGGGAIFSNRTGGTNIYLPGGANFVLYDDTGTAITNATMSTKYIIFSLTYFTA
jgi:hypothetical protein